jgi:hypothetical protein
MTGDIGILSDLVLLSQQYAWLEGICLNDY